MPISPYLPPEGESMSLPEKSRKTLERLSDAIFFVSHKAELEPANSDSRELMDYFAWNGQCPEQLREALENALRTCTIWEETSLEEVWETQHYGELRYWLPKIIPIPHEEGSPAREATLLFQEVTQQKKLLERKSALLSSLSHEIKTPLTTVQTTLYLLIEESLGPLTEKQKDLLETSRNDVQRLFRLLETLLDYARFANEEKALKIQPKEVREFLEVVRQENASYLDMYQLQCCIEGPEGLPQCRMDPKYLSIVFSNFISNAAKYSPEDGVVTLYARKQYEGLRLGVRDEGEGLPDIPVEKLFERFFQKSGEGKSGAGLGLSIAREIIEAHRGSIHCENRSQGGADFYCILPF